MLLAPIVSEAVSDVAAAAARIRVDVAFATALPDKGGLWYPCSALADRTDSNGSLSFARVQTLLRLQQLEESFVLSQILSRW